MKRIYAVLMFLLLGGCAAFRGDLAAPEVTLTGLRLGQGDGLNQTVLVDLLISNPNQVALKLNAISYRVQIEGREFASGNSREPLEVGAGGSKKYTIPASVNLLSGFGLVRDITSKSKNKIAYDLTATLELSGLFSWPVNVTKSGAFSLQ